MPSTLTKNTVSFSATVTIQHQPFDSCETILVTGGSGFIGRHLIAELLRHSFKVRATLRRGGHIELPFEGVDVVCLSGSGDDPADWSDAVAGCNVVIHLAARAHLLRDTNDNSDRAFQLVNVDLTRACGKAAVKAGVKRFIFLSSLGVHGGCSGSDPIRVGSAIKPHTPYSRSKADAERVLKEVVYGTNMELTILRPPMVYGPGAPGNFGVLVRFIARGWPLPLGRVTDNRRSFVAIDNLVELILVCINHPAAANQIFLVSDGEDLSTADLLCRLATAMTRPARLLPVPIGWLVIGAWLLGKQEMFQSLCGSLQVDISHTSKLLGWKPSVSVDDALRRAVEQRV